MPKTEPVNIKGGGAYLGGWTEELGPYVYHPDFESRVAEVLERLGLPSSPIKNHGGYSNTAARHALERIDNDSWPIVVTRT